MSQRETEHSGYLRRLWSFREVALLLVRRDLSVRYKGTLLGFFWSLLRPLLIMAVLSVVFVFLAFRMQITYNIPPRWLFETTKGSYPIFLLVALIPWFFTIGALQDSVNSLILNGNLLKKVSVPGEVFALSAVFSNLVNLLLSLLILLPIIFFLFQIELQWRLFLLPFLILAQLLFTIGISYILAVSNVFFRDVSIIFEVFSMAWFYLSPIFYPLGYVQNHFSEQMSWILTLYLLNPMTALVESYRWILLSGAPVNTEVSGMPWDSFKLGVAAGSILFWTFLGLWLGSWLFNKYRYDIPDEL